MIEGAQFKATQNSRSSDILVTFSSKWKSQISSGSVTSVFRRRYPKSFIPDRMFIYIAAPYSELIGYTKIVELSEIDLSQARNLRNESKLNDDELTKYFEGYSRIGCYSIGHITVINPAISLAKLRREWDFCPPQSFTSISREASKGLELMCIENPEYSSVGEGSPSAARGKK